VSGNFARPDREPDVRHTFWILLSLSLVAFGAKKALAEAPTRIAEPQIVTEPLKEGTFGDDTIVAMLTDLLADEDPVTRSWATDALGETHNPAAMSHIRRSFTDPDLSVRATAVAAAGELGLADSHKLVLEALASENSTILLTAMQTVRQLGLSDAAQLLGNLLGSKDPMVQATATETLTYLSIPAGQDSLKQMLAGKFTSVRLAALENTMLLDSADQVLDELLAAGNENNPPAVRSRAFEALGKFAMTRGRQLVSNASKDSSPIVRRGVVRAYHNAGNGRSAAVFLKDPSAMVRLAAIKACGDLKVKAQIGTLFSLLFAARDDMTRDAARVALAQIGLKQVASRAAAELPKWAEAPLPPVPGKNQPDTQDQADPPATKVVPYTGPSLYQINGNTASCCWLLGKLKSKQMLEYQLSMLPQLDIVSPVLPDAITALADIGDPRAVAPLAQLLERARQQGVRYLRALTRGLPPPPYDPEVSRRIILALGTLKAYQQIDNVLKIGQAKVMGIRLSVSVTTVSQVVPELITEQNQAKAKAFIIGVLADSGCSLTSRFYAAKTAANMKLTGALPALIQILNQEKIGATLMQCAAWAIQEISGQTPAIPSPRVRQGDWVLKRMD